MILKFSCQNQVLTMECPGRLIVADSKQQVYANFTLDDEWNGLTVVAIFSNAWETIRKEVLLTEMCVEIPTSVLTDPGFRVSLNGIGDGGTVLLSTKYMTKPISVHRAGSLVCLQAPDADPELWQQALAAIGPLSDLDTEDKSSLVAAINEALKSGGETVTKEAIIAALEYIPMGPKMVQDEIKNATNNLVRLPGDSLKPEYGTAGQFAVSDGEGGVTWTDYSDQGEDKNIVGTTIGDKCKEFSSLFKNKNKIESFIFFTDPHLAMTEAYTENSPFETSGWWEEKFHQYIGTLKKYYDCTPTSFVVCGGDWLSLHTRDEACFRLGYIDGQMRSKFDRYYPVAGNHDYNREETKYEYTKEDDVGILPIETLRNLWFRDEGATYYSFEGVNTKFYVLDTGFARTARDPFTREQVKWLGGLLKSDNAENSAIILHCAYEDVSEGSDPVPLMADALTICGAYNRRDTVTVNGVQYDFTTCTGKMRFVLCGHKHKDMVRVVNDIPVIMSNDMQSSYNDGEFTINLCLADYDSSILHLVRVGRIEKAEDAFDSYVDEMGNISVEMFDIRIPAPPAYDDAVYLNHANYEDDGLSFGTQTKRATYVSGDSTTETGESRQAFPVSASTTDQPEEGATYYAFNVPSGATKVTVTAPENIKWGVQEVRNGGLKLRDDKGNGVGSSWTTGTSDYQFSGKKGCVGWVLMLQTADGKAFATDYDGSGIYWEYG